jgi:hypothetical protein
MLYAVFSSVAQCGITPQRMHTIRRGLFAMLTGTICPGAL